jgi:cobalt-precorrin 5A hydrolase
MKLAAIVLNEEGLKIANTVGLQLGEIDIFMPEDLAEKFPQYSRYDSLKECVGGLFRLYEGLIFVMAAGIVVRVVSPYLEGKYSDPAVVVVNRSGRYAISLLGGHSAHANELTRQVAGIIGAEAVITTALPEKVRDV